MQQLIFQNLGVVGVSLLLTAIMLVLLRPLAIKISLVDKPNARKTHHFNTPLTGGVGIFFSCILTLLIFSEDLSINLIPSLVTAGLMLVLGTIDDHFDLPPYTKLFGQIGITTLFIISCDCAVTNLGTPFGLPMRLEPGLLSFAFTLLAIVGLTNAINMIDGCDGLAASLIILALSAVLILTRAGLDSPKMLFTLIVLFSLFVFLFFNFSNSKNFKTFLGDGGSLSLGFIVAVSLVEFMVSNTRYDPSIVLWFVAVPVIDFCVVVLRRAIMRKKITAADRSHLHHYILASGYSHLQTAILLSAVALVLLFFGVFMAEYYPSLSFLSFWILIIVYLSFRIFGVRVK